MGNLLSGWHIIAVLAVIILLFGAAKLPVLARSVGQSMKIFKDEIKTGKDGEPVVVNADSPAAATTTPAASTATTTPVVTPEPTQKP